MNQAKEFFTHVWTSASAPTGKEAAFGGTTAVIGTVASLLGGWDRSLQVLLVLMVADYIFGVTAAIKQKKLNSDRMFWGGVRKITVLFVIGLAALIDDWIQPQAPIFRTAAIFFYAGREGLSVIENLGILGVPLPEKIKDFLEQLQKKGEEK